MELLIPGSMVRIHQRSPIMLQEDRPGRVIMEAAE